MLTIYAEMPYYKETRKANHMRKCITCNSDCIGLNKACSIKCKLLDNIIKNENGCWIWRRCTGNNEYGYMRWQGKWLSAHRASYKEFKGDIAKGYVISHICDTPLCINPEHLRQRTQKENMQDSASKKRMNHGEKHHLAKLTDKQILEMRLLHSEGFSLTRLGRIFNCRVMYAMNIINNKARKK